MNKFNGIISALLLLTLSSANAWAKQSSGNDYVSEISRFVYPANQPKEPGEQVYLQDGTSFLAISSDCKSIIRYDIKTGKELETVFDAAKTRESTIGSIEGFALSPEESKLLVYEQKQQLFRRSFTAKYYVYERMHNILKPLSMAHPVQQSPLFSPDGRMVAFVADNNIYLKKLDYDTEVAVTSDGETGSIINGVPDWTYQEEFSTTLSMTWAPDNLTLCYLKYDESNVSEYSFPLYKGACEQKEEYEYYPGTFSYKYPLAGQANSKVSVLSYDVETRKTKEIPLGDGKIEYIPSIAYAYSPERLIVSTLNRGQNRLELYAVNPKSTVAKSLYVEESQTWISPTTYLGIKFSPEYFVISSERSGFNHLYQYSYSGALLRQITSGDYDVTDYYGCDASGNHYFQSTSAGAENRVISLVDRKGKITLLTPEQGTSSAQFSPTMNYYVVNYSDTETPPKYTLYNSSNKEIRVLEDNAYLASRFGNMPKKEFFNVNASDGTQLNGYMIKPSNFDAGKKYPVIMYLYGGPGSQEVLNKWEVDWYDYFADKGYLIVCVDGRGTGGRGRAFQDVVYKRLGYYETLDQLSAARYVSSLPYADSSRIGIFGWSYGGYETLMAISQDDSPYKAAVAVAPVTDWRYYDTAFTERYMQTPQENSSGYKSSSPIGLVNKMDCRLLLMSGTADDNVHLSNTLQYVSHLQQNGKLCDMFLFPNMNHSIDSCNARAVLYAKMLDFFDRGLKE